MKKIKKILTLFKTVIKLEPFYLVYLILNIIRSSIFTILPIGIVQMLVDFYNKGTDFIWVIIASFVFAFLNYTLNFLYSWAQTKDRVKYRSFMAKFENIIFNKIKEIDYEVYQSSDFLNDYTRAIDNGVDACFNTFWSCVRLISCVFEIAIVFSIFTTLNPIIIVYAVAIGVVFWIISVINGKLNWKLSEKQKQNFRERGYIKRQFYLKDACFDIKTSNVKDIFLDYNDAVGDRVVSNIDKFSSLRAFLSFVGKFLISSIYPVSLAFVSYISLKNMDIAWFAALMVASSYLSGSVSRISDSLASFTTRSMEAEAIFKVLDLVGEIEVSGNSEADPFESIKVENLSFDYKNKEALKNIYLEINKGEKIAIVGENGAGKTTLVKLLLRLYDGKDGRILYNGVNYKELIPSSIRRRVGAVFQDFDIYSFTVGENVLLRKVKTKEDEELVYRSLEFAGLLDKVKTFSKGIHTVLTKEFDNNGEELSGGERQKLAIARAFAGGYDLIILDEPNSALDPLAEADIYDKMMRLGKDHTLVFISHRLSSTMKADRIYLFDNGEIVEVGKHKDLMNIENGKYKYMFEIQARKYIEGAQES